MTRSELIQKLAKRHPELDPIDIKTAVITIMKGISTTLTAGGRVEIRGFGSLRVSKRMPREGRNPRTGETISLPMRRGILFRSANELKERVNRPQRHIIKFTRRTHQDDHIQNRQAA